MNNEFDSQDRNVSSHVQKLPVSHDEWEYRARRILPDGPFGYISGGAGSEDTMRSNREAFFEWNIRPRKLRDVSKRNITVSLFGQTFPAPFFWLRSGCRRSLILMVTWLRQKRRLKQGFRLY
ncbi:hypothetical protein D2M30_2148 [Bacillus amyloliquefaciens]|nr:hypothetical protein D2M30_2148 [Bacillus amyloliquefaciens]